MTEQTRKVVVVGGGITGLSAAYYAQKQAKEQGQPIDLTLIESSHRLGGKLQTVKRAGFVIERGADAFFSHKESIRQLVSELGLESDLVHSSAGRSFVLNGEKLYPVPGNSLLGLPSEIWPFLMSSLFSWSGKIRAAGDFVLPRTTVDGDQSLGLFFRRRFGGEVVENLIEPLLLGMFAGNIDRLSLQATFPEIDQAGRSHRSLIYSLKSASSTIPPLPPPVRDAGAFQTFRGGMATLVEALGEALGSATVLKAVKVERISRLDHKAVLSLNNGSIIEADQVILTVPHSAAAALFEPHGLLEDLQQIPSATVATVAMAFPEDAVKQPEDMTGFVVSRNSDTPITSCTWINSLWPEAVPEGYVLMRAFVGRGGDEAIVDLSDSEIEKTVLTDLRKVVPIDGKPEFTVITRWPKAMPQYTVGHKERVVRVKKQLENTFPMVQLAGCGYEGIDLSDCVIQGKQAALQAVQRL